MHSYKVTEIIGSERDAIFKPAISILVRQTDILYRVPVTKYRTATYYTSGYLALSNGTLLVIHEQYVLDELFRQKGQ